MASEGNSSFVPDCATREGQMIARLNSSIRMSRGSDVGSITRDKMCAILRDGDVPPATPLPADTRRAGGFASLPYDSFAK